MKKGFLTAASILAALAGTALTAPAFASDGVNVGSLSCNVSSGIGFIFGSSRSLACVFTRPDGTAERYSGDISRFGVDIGFTNSASIIWTVLAPSGNFAPGSLAGNYGGPTAGATAGVGVGANVLVGGSNKTISLQPVSIEGNTGLNVAAGIAGITLKSAN
jgi:hypothetical protein